MTARRAHGELEHEVLAALWASEVPMTPDAVRTAVSAELAYTTVQTILVRLYEKGVVTREAHGRGYWYAPLLDEADIAARRMRELLDREADRDGILSRFVRELPRADAAALRSALRRSRR